MAPRYKQCPRCQNIVEADDPHCPKCGHQFRTQFAPSDEPTQIVTPPPRQEASPPMQQMGIPPVPPTGPLLDPNLFTCVVCGNPNVQKVSAIWQTGSWASVSAGMSYSYGHFSGGGSLNTVGVSSVHHAGATQLARNLAPPAPPRQNGLAVGCLGIIAVFFGFWGVGFFLLGLAEIGFMVVAVILFSIMGVAIAAIPRQGRQDSERFAYDTLYYNRALYHWERLCYCSRCDCVYHIET